MNISFSHSRVPSRESNAAVSRLKPLLARLCKEPSGPDAFVTLPFEEKKIKELERLAVSYRNASLKYVFLIGIGGSSGGTRAVYHALFGAMDSITPNRFPKIIFLDTVDDEWNRTVEQFIRENIRQSEEFLVIVASKSGETLETRCNTEWLLGFLAKRFGPLADRVICLTGEKTRLWDKMQEKKIVCVPSPDNIGGRFSLFTATTLLPLTFVGVPIRLFASGARAMTKKCLEQANTSPAVASAACAAYHVRNSRAIHDTFFFHPELEYAGKWYRQLVGESLGKHNSSGRPTGITPTVSLGSGDLHSVAQLYLDGPDDKFFTFVRTAMPLRTRLLKKTACSLITDALVRGTQVAFHKAQRPFIDVALRSLSPSSLGMFFQWKMIEVRLLAELLDVNPFDQPAVERYKKEVSRLLI